MELDFSTGVNVIAGANASGKTSVLEALASVLSLVVNPSQTNDLDDADTDEAKHRKSLPAKVCASVSIGNREFAFRQERLSAVSKQTWSLPSMVDIGSAPVLAAYYRAHRDQVSRQSKSEEDDCLDARLDDEKVRSWLAGKNESPISSADAFHRLKILQTVLRTALNDDSLTLSITDDGTEIVIQTKEGAHLWRHSGSGEHALIGLFADLTHRACSLYPNMEVNAPTEVSGVVLIDEIEAHLHPIWQRKLIVGLRKAFPKMQFIATTHSPIVLGEVPATHIHLLYEGYVAQPEASLGCTSDEILVKLMRASEINLEFQKKVDEIYELIDRDRLEEAENLLSAVNQQYGETETAQKLGALLRFEQECEDEDEAL
ncbi:MAG: AAA family ATPase [Sutterellaceae bacterium]|nr:AAA family ATPase [Sutterellaceae bacterium]